MNTTTTVALNLPEPWFVLLQQAAQHQGLSEEHFLQHLVIAQLASLQARGAGRCSLRLGLCCEGPRPLPLFQS